MLFNPLREAITRKISLPLYYTGLEESALVRDHDGAPRTYRLDRRYKVELTVTIPANGFTRLTVSKP